MYFSFVPVFNYSNLKIVVYHQHQSSLSLLVITVIIAIFFFFIANRRLHAFNMSVQPTLISIAQIMEVGYLMNPTHIKKTLS